MQCEGRDAPGAGLGLARSCQHVIYRNVQLGGARGEASRDMELAGDSLGIQGTSRDISYKDI